MLAFWKNNKSPYALLAVLLLAIPFFLKSGYLIHIIITTGVFVILVSGLDVMLGYTGYLSLAQQTFLGLGGYTSALLAMRLHLSFIPSLLAAGLMCGIAGFLVGAVCLRFRSHFFILVSISFAMIAEIVCINLVSVTNGPMGITGIPRPVINLGFVKYTLTSHTQCYFLILVLAIVMVFLKQRIINSRIGRALKAIRENEELAKSVGVNTFAFSLLAFVLSGIYGGFAGAFYAHYINYLSPEMFGFGYMLTMLVMLSIGGKGTLAGPIVGAIVVSFLPEYLRVVKIYRMPIFGIVLLIMTIYMPEGIIRSLRLIPSGVRGLRVWRSSK